MANKIEFFKAVDIIDGAPSFFAIHSIDGKDIGVQRYPSRWNLKN